MPSRFPVHIFVRDRLECTRKLVAWAERNPYVSDIVLIDRESTYEPTLDFLRTCGHDVMRTDNAQPLGHIMQYLCIEANGHSEYVVVSDPDVVPRNECPDDLLPALEESMRKHPWAATSSPSLCLDDLPSHYAKRLVAVLTESPYWSLPFSGGKYFAAQVDTTFQLKRIQSYCVPMPFGTVNAIRLGYPYVAQHLGWYVRTDNLEEDEKYYVDHAVHKGYTNHEDPEAIRKIEDTWMPPDHLPLDAQILSLEFVAKLVSTWDDASRHRAEEVLSRVHRQMGI